MQITGTYIQYYLFCKRQLWLHAYDIRFESGYENVELGKMIHEESYPQRSAKYEEVAIDGIKVDYYSAKDKVIHEIKKSSKLHHTHLWQLKYYIYVFEENGIEGVSGILEYPKERKTEEVYLSMPDKDRIREMVLEVKEIIASEKCPSVINKPLCKNCAYGDFCYVTEI